MGLIIGIIIGTIVVAGAAAAVYVFVFRAKHKKEVLANSEMQGNIPVYGIGSQDQPVQPVAPSMASSFEAQPNPAPATPVMNDITGGSMPANDMAAMPPAPEPPAPTPSFEPLAQNQPEAPVSPPVEDFTQANPDVLNTPANTLDLNQVGANDSMEGTLLDDTSNVGTVSQMAENNTETVIDSGMDDSKVPVTKDEDVVSSLGQETKTSEPASQFEAPVTAAEPAPAPEPLSNIQDFPDVGQAQTQETETPAPQPEPLQPEIPAAPAVPPMSEPPQALDPTSPVPPASVEDNQPADSKEMNI